MPAVAIIYNNPCASGIERLARGKILRKGATALNKAASQTPKSSAGVLENAIDTSPPRSSDTVRDARFRSWLTE
jgi:hypothetical protein